MMCRRSAGIEEVSTPPLRVMTTACSSADKPGTSFTIRDEVLVGVIVAVSVGMALGAPLLVNHGGKVLTAPQVSGIYLGGYWSTAQGASDALHTDTFIQTWLSGPSVTGVLAQYGVGSASFAS